MQIGLGSEEEFFLSWDWASALSVNCRPAGGVKHKHSETKYLNETGKNYKD